MFLHLLRQQATEIKYKLAIRDFLFSDHKNSIADEDGVGGGDNEGGYKLSPTKEPQYTLLAFRCYLLSSIFL